MKFSHLLVLYCTLAVSVSSTPPSGHPLLALSPPDDSGGSESPRDDSAVPADPVKQHGGCVQFPDDNARSDSPVVSQQVSQQVVAVGDSLTRRCKDKYGFSDKSRVKVFTCLDDGLWDDNEVCAKQDDIPTTSIPPGTVATMASVVSTSIVRNDSGFGYPLPPEQYAQLFTVMSFYCVIPVVGTYSCSCFPSSSEVVLRGGRRVKMKDLDIGQQVLTVSEGIPQYQPVLSMMHREPHHLATFVELTTSGNRTVSLTKQHFVIVLEEDIMKHVTAADVEVGNDLVTVGEDGNGATLERVVAKHEVQARGLFAPLTASGSIVVDSVLTSVYIEGLGSPAHLHTATWPLRVLPPAVTHLSAVSRPVLPLGLYNWAHHALHYYTALS